MCKDPEARNNLESLSNWTKQRGRWGWQEKLEEGKAKQPNHVLYEDEQDISEWRGPV